MLTLIQVLSWRYNQLTDLFSPLKGKAIISPVQMQHESEQKVSDLKLFEKFLTEVNEKWKQIIRTHQENEITMVVSVTLNKSLFYYIHWFFTFKSLESWNKQRRPSLAATPEKWEPTSFSSLSLTLFPLFLSLNSKVVDRGNLMNGLDLQGLKILIV